MKLPAAGTTAADAREALDAAMHACRGVSSFAAEVGVSGSVAGRRVRARLLAGLASPGSARLEAVAPFGQPFFLFVARDNDATLLLPRDRRVIERGRAAEVLQAAAGVPLDATDLRIALTGCAVGPRASEATLAGPDWRIVPDGRGEVYLRREARDGPWRIVAAVRRGVTTGAPTAATTGVVAGAAAGTSSPAGPSWRAEYRDFPVGPGSDGLPRTVRLVSADGRGFDLRLSLSQVETNPSLDAEVFSLRIPPGTAPITVEELTRSGPLAGGEGVR